MFDCFFVDFAPFFNFAIFYFIFFFFGHLWLDFFFFEFGKLGVDGSEFVLAELDGLIKLPEILFVGQDGEWEEDAVDGVENGWKDGVGVCVRVAHLLVEGVQLGSYH